MCVRRHIFKHTSVNVVPPLRRPPRWLPVKRRRDAGRQETGRAAGGGRPAQLSVAGPAAHVAAARLRRQDLHLVVVAASGAVQANFDLRGDVHAVRPDQTGLLLPPPPPTPSPWHPC